MKKVIRTLNLAFAVVLVYALAALPSPVAAADVAVSIAVTDRVDPGETFTAGVIIENVIDFDAGNYDIIYDPTVIVVDNISDGLVGTTPIPVSRWNYESAQGRITIFNNVVNYPGVSGSGYLAEIHFRAVGAAGTSSTIAFTGEHVLGDKNAQQITVASWTNATVQIASGSTTTTTTTTTPGSGGGGGGGGGGGDNTPIINYLDAQGRLSLDVEANSADGKVTLTLPKGTVVKNRIGGLVSSISIRPFSDAGTSPELPEFAMPVGRYYVLGPAGATFTPAITLTFEYNPAETGDESSLVIFRWNETGQAWEPLVCRIDAGGNTISTDIDHFSIYAVMATNHPAAFTVSDLAISPAEVVAGKALNVSVLVTNTGDLKGDYEVTLLVDGEPAGNKLVTLTGHESQTVTFYPSVAAGTRVIKIGDLTATLEVLPAETAAPGLTEAAFIVSDLTVTPARAATGDPVVVSVRVKNTGDLAGSYEDTLFVDGAPARTRLVTVAGHAEQTVSFSTTAGDAGTKSIKIGDLSSTFEVIPAAPSTAEPALADFTVSNLTVTPAEVNAGSPVAITALVTNKTGQTLSTEIILKINGITASSQKVTLAAESGQTVTFNIVRDAAGLYIARIGDSTANFQVIAGPATIHWSMVLIILCVVLAIGAVLRFTVFARKKAD